MAPAVDEEGRRAVDTAEIGAVDILGHAHRVGVPVELVHEALAVETQVPGVLDEVAGSEGVLMLKEQVVHLPERVLTGCGFRGLGGDLRIGMDVAQRQMPPDVPDVSELLQELPHDRLRATAVGAFEIAVLDDSDRRIDGASIVVSFRVDVDVEIDDWLVGPE